MIAETASQTPSPAPPPVPAKLWRQYLETLPSRSQADVINPAARLVVVSAHPDDETIGAGRLIADHPGEVVAVTFSAGERCVVHPDFDPVALAACRLGEWHGALCALGASALDGPMFPDGELGDHVEEISSFVRELVQPDDVVLTVWSHDPHPDHRAVGRAANRAAAARVVPCLNYLVWTPYWMEPIAVQAASAADGDPLITDRVIVNSLIRVPSQPHAERAWRGALAAFHSQFEPLAPGWPPVVPVALVERHQEQLLLVAGDQT